MHGETLEWLGVIGLKKKTIPIMQKRQNVF